jgi:hypothetical protein
MIAEIDLDAAESGKIKVIGKIRSIVLPVWTLANDKIRSGYQIQPYKSHDPYAAATPW